MSALSRKKELLVVGIMNGTSLDGIDYVLCKIKKEGTKRILVKFQDQEFFPFASAIREKLKQAADREMKVDELARLHHELGRLYSQQLQQIKKKKKWKIDLIGVHGQTIFHEAGDRALKSTLQIGEPSYLSADFLVPVVSDFRVADLAVQGQGAPIASFFHKIVFQSQFPKQTISLHNLGGISNYSLLDAKGNIEKSFDTGPANMLMDLFIQQLSKGKQIYDKNGSLGAQGLPAQKVVDKALKNTPFFSLPPPKSCGREDFGLSYLGELEKQMGSLSPQDKMATLVELSARSIAQAYLQFSKKIPQKIILCGGGALNLYFKNRIQYHLPQAQVLTTEDCGWPVTSIEGAAFALLAACRVWNLPSNIPKTTGASKAVTMGKVSEVF